MADRVTGGINGSGGKNVTQTYKEGNAAPAKPFQEKSIYKNKAEERQSSMNTAKLLGKIIQEGFSKQAEKSKNNRSR